MEPTRILKMENGVNFRELGGYKTLDNKTIKWHKLLRSGKMADLSDRDAEFLTEYGLRTDVDFRSPEEKSKAPDRKMDGVDYNFVPVFTIDETQSTKNDQELERKMNIDPNSGLMEMRRVYRDMIRQTHPPKAYRKFFDLLLANSDEDSTLLFHCTAGKDRTGMGAILLLNALNVDEDTIKADYLLTNRATKTVIDQRIMELKLQNKNSAVIQSIKALQSVDISYYNAAMDEVKKLSGDIKNYLREYIKVSDSEIEDLKKIYLK